MLQNRPCSLTKLVIIIILFSLLSGFALKQPTYTPTPVTPTATSTPLTYEPSSIIHGSEPVESPAVNPPDFANDTTSHELGGFDLVSANACYGLYRKENGPTLFKDETDFIEKMESFKNDYMKKNGIELIRGSKDGVADSAVIRKNADGTYSMMRSLVAADGAIAYPEASYFDPSTTQEWINLPGEPELFIGDDKHSYTGIKDANGDVTKWLKTVGANRDNIADQLVAVTMAESAPAAGEPAPAANASEGAVKTADGASVIVEGGKLYKVDASGTRTETELSKEVLTDVFEAGDLVKQLHPELFEGDQKALLDFLLPANTYKDGLYDHSVIGYRWSKSKKYDSWDADVTGKALELIRLKTPDGFPEGQEAGILMLAVYGLKEPFPVLVSMEKNGETSLLFDYSQTFDLLKARGSEPLAWSKNYQNTSDLAADLINQRIKDMFPVGVAEVTDAYLDEDFSFRKDDDLAVSLEKYQLGKYGAVIHNMVPEIKKGFAQKLPTGAMFDKILDRLKSDPKLRFGFIGFISKHPWAEKYKTE